MTIKKVLNIFLVIFFAGLQPAQAEDSYELKIEAAKWEAGDSLLVVKGTAPRGSSVVIKNGDDLSVIKQVISNREGKWRIKLKMTAPPCKVQAVADGFVVTRTVKNASQYCNSDSGSGGGSTPSGDYVSLAINDLGMHCADLDYQVFSILPPFNVVHGQVIKKGASPEIMDNTQVDLVYKAAPSPDGTITTTSRNINGVFKSNFWTEGLTTYGAPGLPEDVGLLDQAMPGTDNVEQPFLKYINDMAFFSDFPFGYEARGLKRFAAEGIPILPAADPVLDANGNFQVPEAPYPLMKVTALSKGANPTELASVRTVLPVASEADCQICHASQEICGLSTLTYGVCEDHGDAEGYEPVEVGVNGDLTEPVPGNSLYQQVVNAAKINILRLHDAKYETTLDRTRNVVCASCHYSPALDLHMAGPNETQLGHISMSRAMHGHHGETGLFPDMPQPKSTERENMTSSDVQDILQDACYSCHPGKRTQCLRGAMAGAGIVCQDCHGNMNQVGDDFSANQYAATTPGKRVPWAHEPGCQSCHTGDAVNNMASDTGVITADDGIRLLQAFRKNDPQAKPIIASNRRFAETRDAEGNEHLYRLSNGHGGVMCEGCHGSTHAVWPNPLIGANDNLTAEDLQGHSGTLTECSVCHADANLGLTLKGPHGMHPVGSRYWNEKHEDISERNAGQCKTCHGQNGEGTVLSRTSMEREWICKDEKGSLCQREDQRITVARGTKVSCTQCHENKINGDD